MDDACGNLCSVDGSYQKKMNKCFYCERGWPQCLYRRSHNGQYYFQGQINPQNTPNLSTPMTLRPRKPNCFSGHARLTRDIGTVTLSRLGARHQGEQPQLRQAVPARR
jgi:hypothetical protein